MKMVVRSGLSSISFANVSMSVIDLMAFLYNSSLTLRMSKCGLSSMGSSLVNERSGGLTRLSSSPARISWVRKAISMW